jgi:hypothetical protein
MTPGSGEFLPRTHVAHWESLLGSHISTFDAVADIDVQIC